MSQVPPLNPYQGPAYDPNLGPRFDANDPYFRAAAAAQLSGPSIALMSMAIIFGFMQLLGLAINILGLGIRATPTGGLPAIGPSEALLTGGLVIISGGLSLLISGIIFFGALRMGSLQNYSLAMVSSILAMVPCFSPCCVIGLPIGIWSVVVLSRPEVKGAFFS